MNNLFKIKPARIVEDIPVFSEDDWYIENYQKINNDQLIEMAKNGTNPFIEENLWQEAEDLTLSQIRKYVKEDNHILDIGVGLGRLLGKLNMPVRKIGMDITFDFLKEARKKNISVCLSKIEDMPFKDNSFDVVVCTDVLEHVLDLHLCIKKIVDVVKKGGYIIIRVPYKETLSGYLEPGFPYKFSHFRNFDEYSLQIFPVKLFNCEVLEWNLAGHWLVPARLKWGTFLETVEQDSNFLKLASRSLKIFLKRIKRKNPEYYKTLFVKTEISMVFRKK